MKFTTLPFLSATIFAADPGAFHSLYWYAIGLVAAAAIFFWGHYLVYRSSEEKVLPLEVHDGGFEIIRGTIQKGFPRENFIWSGDPCEILVADSEHPNALRFSAVGEPNLPFSQRNFCDVFQVIDLRSLRAELENSGSAFVELYASFLDGRSRPAGPVKFASKIYAFKGLPNYGSDGWPPSADQTLAYGAEFHESSGGGFSDWKGDLFEWKILKTRCLVPTGADFLVVQIGVGSAGPDGQPSPELGALYADDIVVRLHARPNKPVIRN